MTIRSAESTRPELTNGNGNVPSSWKIDGYDMAYTISVEKGTV
ncbi:hypothetical protein CCACVL1_11405 [Corchorus capsularis]|uniref:Uncharacterized protein n=1 Tax=Corchorus capsularis TaxID=210143 RepID=A0A1R3ILD4_COCAP|nr:hypothetical protein CCACVL1_11405 [Corchorus capsularis]